MKRWLLSVLLVVGLCLPSLGQTTSFWTDRAVATFPVGTGTARTTALIPIQFGQVRVCTSADIGSPTTPCPDLASITDINGNPLTVVGGNFGQIKTDVVGRFSFGATPGTYLIQVAPGSSNVPQLNYPITVAFNNSLGNLVTGNNTWTGTNTFNAATTFNAAATFNAATTFNAGINGVGFQRQIFTTSGTFTIPAGITQVKVTVVGGGGGGGGNPANNSGSGGGAAGATFKWLTGLTPGNTLIVTIGAAGVGGNAANGTAGGNSTVASGTQTIGTITATGGGLGVAVSASNGGGGGSSSGGDLNLNGNPGFANPLTSTGGNGGGSIFGGGGLGGLVSNGSTAGSFGSGGGGSANGGATGTGGNGTPGIVIFEWVQ